MAIRKLIVISIHEVFADLDAAAIVELYTEQVISIHEVFADLDHNVHTTCHISVISIHEVFADLDG